MYEKKCNSKQKTMKIYKNKLITQITYASNNFTNDKDVF